MMRILQTILLVRCVVLPVPAESNLFWFAVLSAEVLLLPCRQFLTYVCEHQNIAIESTFTHLLFFHFDKLHQASSSFISAPFCARELLRSKPYLHFWTALRIHQHHGTSFERLALGEPVNLITGLSQRCKGAKVCKGAERQGWGPYHGLGNLRTGWTQCTSLKSTTS